MVININHITTIDRVQYDNISEKYWFEITLSSQQLHTFMDADKEKLDKERERFISLIKE